MPSPRPAIPEPVKRAVRQRCGFGCVLCGIPIYHYDHMTPYEQVQVHAEENLTLLCPTHHQEKTSGLLDVVTVTAANADPVNMRGSSEGTTPHLLSAKWVEPRFLLAGNTFSWPGPFTAIEAHGTTLLGFRLEDGGLLLQIRMFDSTGEEVLRVRDSELKLSTDSWDVAWSGGTFTVRSAPRQISVEVEFSPPNLVTIAKGRVFHRGAVIDFSAKGLAVGSGSASVRWSGCFFRCGVGISIDDTGVKIGPS